MPRSSVRLESTMIGTVDPFSRSRRMTSNPSRPGRPRSRIDHIGRAAPHGLQRRLAVLRLDHADGPAPRGWSEEAPDRRLVVDDQHAQRRAGGHQSASSARGRSWRGTGKVKVKTAPRPIRPIAGGDGAAHGLDEAAADGKAQARCRPAVGRRPARGRICRRCGRDRRRECRRLRSRIAAPRPRPHAAAADVMSVPGGAYLAALSSRLNSTCSNSTRSSCSIGRSGGRRTSTGCRSQNAGRPSQGAADRSRTDRPCCCAARQRRIPAASCPEDCR